MPDSNLIAQLESQEAAKREGAATTIYGNGADQAQTVYAALDEKLGPGLYSHVPLVGVAVTLERFGRIRQAWGNPPLSEVPEEHYAQEFSLHSGQAHLDILAPANGGPIGKFLERFGEGIQQIELMTWDVQTLTVLLRSQGAAPIYDCPRPGANGTLVNFILLEPLKAERRLLCEFVQLVRGAYGVIGPLLVSGDPGEAVKNLMAHLDEFAPGYALTASGVDSTSKSFSGGPVFARLAVREDNKGALRIGVSMTDREGKPAMSAWAEIAPIGYNTHLR